MDLSKKLLLCISEFEEYVKLTDSLFIKNYSIDIPPILAMHKKIIPRKGTMKCDSGNVIFKFHGMGCLFEFENKIIVDFDYRLKTFDYLGFSTHKLHQFIKTNGNRYNELSNMENLQRLLDELEEDNRIQKIKPPYNTYELIEKGN